MKLNKRYGKTKYSGRRRTVTRKSGFKSHPNATGGFYKLDKCMTFTDSISLDFEVHSKNKEEKYAGYGFYFRSKNKINFHTDLKRFSKQRNITEYPYPNWSKCGDIWNQREYNQERFFLKLIGSGDIDIYDPKSGIFWSEHFDNAKESYMKRLWEKVPEGLFIDNGEGVSYSKIYKIKNNSIHIKECNRCARYLPINIENERNTLSFSNHHSTIGCSHTGFGLLKNSDTQKDLKLDYGFQLECRFCKSFVVNMPLNPKRTSDQMKEDGLRRRYFENLISELYQHSPQLSYKYKTGKELSSFIWEKFNKKCFKCSVKLKKLNEMNLDHTRPLAFLWQLDETATALCRSCNSLKSDKFPIEFYTKEELKKLSVKTNISLKDLQNNKPNIKVLNNLIERKDWFINEFLKKDDLNIDRDGKKSSELICKSLDRVCKKADINFSFVDLYYKSIS